ncbi:MAG TPA: M23 family metallopeptidase [Candidatus Woesebacteria bacterium]|nr:M23 family metallopeptidase [Candidatus Woesebacteria bacterium]HUM57420.1 M23 family metallopeptidase [Candidatus Woesebacteria bacterium]
MWNRDLYHQRQQGKLQFLIKDLQSFLRFLRSYGKIRLYVIFDFFEKLKDALVSVLHQKRGKYTRPFLHFGTIALSFFMVIFGPRILNSNDETMDSQLVLATPILAISTATAPDFYTYQAEEVRQYRGGEIITHVVEEGETISDIAERYGLRKETILWANNLTEKSTIKPGQSLEILPVDGVRHKVVRGDTIYSIGKKYGLTGSQVQMIVDYPFNEFLNDETFDLVAGQYLMVPEGRPPTAAVSPIATSRSNFGVLTPDAGTVSATGSFIWPASGGISQGYSFYHKAIDISNGAGGAILAADAGVVAVAGWVDGYGYGNRVMIDHGNGFVTLYAHLSVVQVRVGQRVGRGDVIGQMGSTGRSTGTHLHFEIRQGGALQNPFNFLR